MSKTFLRKFLFQLFPVWFTVSSAAAQAGTAHAFGEGVATIGWYTFTLHDTIARDPISILKIPDVYSSTYFIKQNKILRKDQTDPGTGNDSAVDRKTDINGGQMTTTAHVEYEHPAYLIDWNKKKVYAKGGEEAPLQKETREVFYRTMTNNRSVVLSLKNDTSFDIAHMKCFKGLAKDRENGVFTFFYSKTPLSVCSPLNGFLPADFPYNVLRVDLTAEFAVAGGKTSKTILIFQVLAIEGRQLPDKLFEIH